jgi:hypothetical protein
VLTNLEEAELISEVRDSQIILEQSLGIPIQAIAYPGGHVNRQVRQVAERYYNLGFATDLNVGAAAGDPYRIPRFDPSFCQNLSHFRKKFSDYINNGVKMDDRSFWRS